MPRDLPLGNGSLLINFDQTGQIRDIYWPHVGQENHTRGKVCRLGIWVNEQFSWLDDHQWQRHLSYGHNSLVTDSVLENTGLGIKLRFRDTVDFHENVLVRQCTVENDTDSPQDIRLFFCHDLSISGTTVGDSAYYEPERQALFHYKGKRWFMIGFLRGWPGNWQNGLDQWAVGIKDGQDLEGAWRDAEDGQLSGNPVAQGRIDSVAALHFKVEAGAQDTAWYILTVGEDYEAVTRIYRAVLRKGPIVFLNRTAAYWQLWATKEGDMLTPLPDNLTALYRRSLLILRTQIDNTGAIIAANDYDIAQFNRDTYSYMWPRDGALVAAALVDAGYSELTRRFFDFCHKIITKEGFLLHKYTPDGSLASSWHAWSVNGEKRLPIQEDETALVLWALWRHFARFRDIEFMKCHYRGLVIRAAEWLCSYLDEESGLPLPSWDLWEERYGIHAWTVAAVWAGLHAAANFAEAFGENEHAMRYQKKTARMQQVSRDFFWDEEKRTFVRTITGEKHTPVKDGIMDASLTGLWAFGMIKTDDPRMIDTMQSMQSRLWLQSPSGGMARYENDSYHQVSHDTKKIPGNPWFICTLWLAQWYIMAAKETKDLKQAQELIEWAAARTLVSGVMAEQVHPQTNEPLSVSPLTWSHATYVSALLAYNKKSAELAAQ